MLLDMSTGYPSDLTNAEWAIVQSYSRQPRDAADLGCTHCAVFSTPYSKSCAPSAHGATGFSVQPRRWIVQRSFARVIRRLAGDVTTGAHYNA